MSDTAISAEVAKEQLDGLLKHYEIDLTDGDDAQQQARQGAYDKVIKALRAGRLEIKEDFTVVQNVRGNPPLTYRELDGRAKIAMGKCGENDHHGKVYALMGSLSGAGANAIHMLKGVDVTTAESLGILFLAA